MKPEDKPCVACVHCTIAPRSMGTQHYHCAKLGLDCYVARAADGDCGLSATHWEAKGA